MVGWDKQQRTINLASPRLGSRVLGTLIDDGGHSLVNQGSALSLGGHGGPESFQER